MKDIYIINHGDSVDKIKYEYNLNEDLITEYNEKFGIKYLTKNNKDIEIMVVKNYLPYYEYKIKKDDTLIGLMSKGYKIQSSRDISCGDIVIMNKPKSIRYVVKPLEKLIDISKKFGVSEEYIVQVNELMSKTLFVGQILWL